MFFNVELNLFLCDFDDSKNDDYNEEDLSDFDFFDSCIDFLDVILNTEIFKLDSSMYIILIEHFLHEPSILKTTKKRLNYAHIFKLLTLENKFSDTFKIIDDDIIKNCWDQKIRFVEKVHKRLMKLDRQLEL